MAENIRLAFRGILSHKLRSFLTMLGVIIGIASIIAIVSTIQGTNQQIMENLIQRSPADNPVFAFMDKKRAQGKPYFVYMTAGANKFLKRYYAKVVEHLNVL